MAFTENELPLIEANLRKFCDELDNPEIIDKLKHDFRIEDQSIILFDVRPHFRNPKQKIETPIAKLRFFRSRNEWQLYWMRGDLKWDAYEPNPIGIGYMPLLKIVNDDEYCCFFG